MRGGVGEGSRKNQFMELLVEEVSCKSRLSNDAGKWMATEADDGYDRSISAIVAPPKRLKDRLSCVETDLIIL